MESVLIDFIILIMDDFFDFVLDGVVMCGGDLNIFNFKFLLIVFGFIVLVEFFIRGDVFFDNCLINKFELF